MLDKKTLITQAEKAIKIAEEGVEVLTDKEEVAFLKGALYSYNILIESINSGVYDIKK